MKRPLAAAIFALAGIAGTAGMFAAPASAATPKDALIIVREISSIADWDPGVSQILDVQEINSDIYDRLIGYDPRNPVDLVPVVAEKWTVSPDGKQFIFTIRKGIKFHSGNPLTAHDVAYTFKRLIELDREPSSNLKQIGITKENVDLVARAMEDHLFVLTLPESYATSYILAMLSAASLGIVDKKLLEQHAQGGDFGTKWLSRRSSGEASAGSGPFRITTYRASDIVVLERNDSYWRFKPPLRRVIFRHVPESGAQRLAIERGDADIAFNLTTQDVDGLQGKPGVTVKSYPSRRIFYFGFNTLNKPFDDPRVLKAMKHLIDYDGIEKTLMRNLGFVHQTFIPKGWLGGLQERPYKLDVERARALLAEAGLQQGFGFRLSVANRRPESDIATAFQAVAAQANVKVEISTMPAGQLIPMYRDRKTESLILSFYGPYGDPHAVASKFAFNPAALAGEDPSKRYPAELTWRLGWAPKELSQKVVAASKEPDQKKRVAMYHEIQRTYWDTAPFAQTFQAVLALGMRSNVEGYQYGSRGSDTSFAAVSKR